MKVKHIDKGINPSYASKIYFSSDYLLKGFKIGVVVASMIALTVTKVSTCSGISNKASLLVYIYRN